MNTRSSSKPSTARPEFHIRKSSGKVLASLTERPFTSIRERRLWLSTVAVVAAIYATLGLTGRLASTLRDAELLSAFFALGMVLIGVAIAVQGLLSRPGSAEIAVALGVATAYFMVFVRMGSLEERTHLIEYGIVALLIHAALNERAIWRPHVPAPALLAVTIAGSIGVVDELIQALLPTRVFDPRDILFNIVAAVFAVGAVKALRWARRRTRN